MKNHLISGATRLLIIGLLNVVLLNIGFVSIGFVSIGFVSSDAHASEWEVVTVDGASIDAGKYASLKIDSFDLPHIAYRVENPDALKYTWLQATNWLYETPSDASGMGMFIDLDLNTNDSAHISHFDPAEKDLMHTWRSGGSYLTTDAVSTTGNVGYHTGIDLDLDLNPSFTDICVGQEDLEKCPWRTTGS